MYSVELYRRLQRGENPVGWTESGGIKLASVPSGWRRSAGRSAGRARMTCRCTRSRWPRRAERFPLVDTRRRRRAPPTSSPTATSIPSQLCYALAAGARARGVQHRAAHPGARHRHVARRSGASVRTDRGDIAVRGRRQLRRHVRRRDRPAGRSAHPDRPDVAPVPGHRAVPRTRGDRRCPRLRDPDLLVYFRQEVDGLVMGGYERDPAPWTATRTQLRRDPARLQRQAAARGLAAVRGDRARTPQRRVPVMADSACARSSTGRRRSPRTTSSAWARPRSPGLFVAAGFCAHGIAGAGGIGRVMADGSSPANRASTSGTWTSTGSARSTAPRLHARADGRELPDATTTSHTRDCSGPRAGRCACRRHTRWHAAPRREFGEKAGWERVDWYESNARQGTSRCDHEAGRAATGRRRRGVEHLTTRASAGLFDEIVFRQDRDQRPRRSRPAAMGVRQRRRPRDRRRSPTRRR